MSQENKEKKPWYKKWWIWVIVAIVVICVAIGNNGTESAEPQNTANESAEEVIVADPELEEIKFNISKVNNDTTGNWRVTTISEPIVMSDHAVAYYQKYFEGNNEIHAIINFNKNTTTQISTLSSDSPELICVTTYEYVKGEEHDAKKLFSGEVLTEKYYNINTGEEVQFD